MPYEVREIWLQKRFPSVLLNPAGWKTDQKWTTQIWCWPPGGIYPPFAFSCSSFKLLSTKRRLVRNGLCFSHQTLWYMEGTSLILPDFFFVRFCWKHEPFASTLTEVPEFTTPGGQGFFFHWMCKRIQMRKWAVLEFTRFWLCNLSYIKSVLLISDLGMIATALSCHLSAIFSDWSFVPRIGFLHAVCWNNF